MNSSKMLVSLTPWALFSVVINHRGPGAAGPAAVLAALLGLVLVAAHSRSGVKALDITGIATFAGLAAAAFAGGTSMAAWVADYGRGTSAAVLGLAMLSSTVIVPFSEQYARESAAAEHWHSPRFRATNRRISATWGLLVLVMAAGHLTTGVLAQHPTQAGDRAINLLLNWGVPVLLITLGVQRTTRIAQAAGTVDTVEAAKDSTRDTRRDSPTTGVPRR